MWILFIFSKFWCIFMQNRKYLVRNSFGVVVCSSYLHIRWSFPFFHYVYAWALCSSFHQLWFQRLFFSNIRHECKYSLTKRLNWKNGRRKGNFWPYNVGSVIAHDEYFLHSPHLLGFCAMESRKVLHVYAMWICMCARYYCGIWTENRYISSLAISTAKL